MPWSAPEINVGIGSFIKKWHKYFYFDLPLFIAFVVIQLFVYFPINFPLNHFIKKCIYFFSLLQCPPIRFLLL